MSSRLSWKPDKCTSPLHICFIIIDLLRQLYSNDSLIAYCRRYDKRLKPPSEGALRVRTSHHSHCNVFLVSFPNMFQTEFTTLIFSLCNFVSMKILSDQHQHVSPLPLFSGRVKSSLRDWVHYQAEVDRSKTCSWRWKQVEMSSEVHILGIYMYIY